MYQFRKQLGRYLREKRGDTTLKQFAGKLGISDSTLQRLEIGQQNITIDTLELLMKQLKCNFGDIFDLSK